jgi:hypothetical protein
MVDFRLPVAEQGFLEQLFLEMGVVAELVDQAADPVARLGLGSEPTPLVSGCRAQSGPQLDGGSNGLGAHRITGDNWSITLQPGTAQPRRDDDGLG